MPTLAISNNVETNMENLLKVGQQFLNTQNGKTAEISKIDEDGWFTVNIVLEDESLSSSYLDVAVVSPREIKMYISEGIYEPK